MDELLAFVCYLKLVLDVTLVGTLEVFLDQTTTGIEDSCKVMQDILHDLHSGGKGFKVYVPPRSIPMITYARVMINGLMSMTVNQRIPLENFKRV